jgi:hypothetical protein
MLTFREFRESENVKDQEKALDVVRKGMNLQRGSDFWDDLLQLCGNADGMAALLDVPREKITGLAGRISKMIERVGDTDETNSKDRLIKTGSKT